MPKQANDPSFIEEAGAALAISGMLLFSWLLRPWYSRWGVPKGEIHRPLPGDDIVAQPMLEVTRAITIQSPPEASLGLVGAARTGEGRALHLSAPGEPGWLQDHQRNTDRTGVAGSQSRRCRAPGTKRLPALPNHSH